MNFRKHKIFILSFLSICLLSGNLIYVFQNFELIKHKKNQQKSNEISATLKLTIQDWIAFGGEEKVNLKEINFKEKMFDIVKIEIKEKVVLLYGHFDKEEDGLLAKIKHQKKNLNEKLAKFSFFTLYFLQEFQEIKFHNPEYFQPKVKVVVCFSLLLGTANSVFRPPLV